MELKIKPIYLGRMIGNCYLLTTEIGYILIDTGRASKRKKLEKELNDAGCKPGILNLIMLTHGDFDHTGNCAYLRDKYNAQIAMHSDDSKMVELGNMFYNRGSGNFLIKFIVNKLFRIRKFKPDFTVDDGYDLSKYGLNAKVIHLPGHSKGSIGILTANGDLLCGDLFCNTRRPELNPIMDDVDVANASVEKLKGCKIETVYPGHGTPFSMKLLMK